MFASLVIHLKIMVLKYSVIQCYFPLGGVFSPLCSWEKSHVMLTHSRWLSHSSCSCLGPKTSCFHASWIFLCLHFTWPLNGIRYHWFLLWITLISWFLWYHFHGFLPFSLGTIFLYLTSAWWNDSGLGARFFSLLILNLVTWLWVLSIC